MPIFLFIVVTPAVEALWRKHYMNKVGSQRQLVAMIRERLKSTHHRYERHTCVHGQQTIVAEGIIEHEKPARFRLVVAQG